MLWVDEVLHCEPEGPHPGGVCRVRLAEPRAFHGADGKVRPSAVVEWIAQSYGFVKACAHLLAARPEQGADRAFLVGINDCEVNLSGLAAERSVLVHVRELHNFHPAYVLEGKVTSEDGLRVFGSARIKVFAGEAP